MSGARGEGGHRARLGQVTNTRQWEGQVQSMN